MPKDAILMLTKFHLGGNPAFKVYDVDPDTYEIMDSRVFRSTHSYSLVMFVVADYVTGDMASPSFQTNRR
jgi:hypothetical protein